MNELSPQQIALRNLQISRLERLEKQSKDISEHLKLKPRDISSAKKLLSIQQQIVDISKKLSDENWYPNGSTAYNNKTKNKTIINLNPVIKNSGNPSDKSKYIILAPVPINKNIVPEEQLSPERYKDCRRDWTIPAPTEVILPKEYTNEIIESLLRFTTDLSPIIENWAIQKYGSSDEAKIQISESALIPSTIVNRRAILIGTKYEDFIHLSDEEFLKDKKVIRAISQIHQQNWIKEILKEITIYAPSGSKDSIYSRMEANLKSYHSGVNSDKVVNAQFPYLENKKLSIEEATEELLQFTSLTQSERLSVCQELDRGEIKHLSKIINQSNSNKFGSEKRLPWNSREVVSGTIARKREGCLVWDNNLEKLALLLPNKNGTNYNSNRFIYVDGELLDSDSQLIQDKHKELTKKLFALPLDCKHDFLRYYTKHIENHNPDASLERRALCKCFQFFLILPDKYNLYPKLFIRPVMKFYCPNYEVQDTHSFKKDEEGNSIYIKPDCRYFIGIDRGINDPIRAKVFDTKTNTFIYNFTYEGRKDDWNLIKNNLAFYCSQRDNAKNSGNFKAQQKAQLQLKIWRRKEKSLNKAQTVEAVAKLVDFTETEYGCGNYCFILEQLNDMNNQGANRIKYIAQIRDALVNQMIKRGYKYSLKDKYNPQIDGIKFVFAQHTSQISPFSDWIARTDSVKELAKELNRPIGRNIGYYYAKFKNGVAPKKLDYINLGCKLFLDPFCTEFNGRKYPYGIIVDADDIGAINIATRPIVQNELFKTTKMNEIAQKQSAFLKNIDLGNIVTYDFKQIGDDPFAQIVQV